MKSYIDSEATWFEGSREERRMDAREWWVIDIVLPAILLLVLLWLALNRRSNRMTDETEAGTRALYREEEQRRRDGTDASEK